MEKDDDDGEKDYNELVKRVSSISQPLASKKLTKKIYKVLQMKCLLMKGGQEGT
jgi:hypothetical protein